MRVTSNQLHLLKTSTAKIKIQLCQLWKTSTLLKSDNYILAVGTVRTQSVNKMNHANMELSEFQKYSFNSEIEIISTATEFLNYFDLPQLSKIISFWIFMNKQWTSIKSNFLYSKFIISTYYCVNFMRIQISFN